MLKVQVLKEDLKSLDYEATLINIFMHTITHEERAAITADGDVWSVPASRVVVMEV